MSKLTTGCFSKLGSPKIPKAIQIELDSLKHTVIEPTIDLQIECLKSQTNMVERRMKLPFNTRNWLMDK